MDLIAVSLPERTSTPNQFQTICNWRVRQALITFHGSTLTADLYKSQCNHFHVNRSNSFTLSKNKSKTNDHFANILYLRGQQTAFPFSEGTGRVNSKQIWIKWFGDSFTERLHKLVTWQLICSFKKGFTGWPWTGGLKTLEETDLTNLST